MAGVKRARSLVAFARDERLKECVVCQLPEEVREQLVGARRIPLETRMAWLRSEFGFKGSTDEFTAHGAGHHDRKLKELAS